jgi:hypothetical protein
MGDLTSLAPMVIGDLISELTYSGAPLFSNFSSITMFKIIKINKGFNKVFLILHKNYT